MLQSSRVIVRAVSESDVSELALKLGDMKSLGAYLPWAFVSEANLRREYAEHGFLREQAERYVITDNTGTLIGSIWLFKSVPYFDALEMGYHIFDGEHRGKGYASEALTLVTDFAFRAKQINRLEIRVAVGNTASEKVATKTGFTHEGIARQAAFSNGRHHDMNCYSLLREEWKSAHDPHSQEPA